MVNALDSGLQAIRAGAERLDRAASRVATEGVRGDLAGDFVQMSEARAEVKAGVAVVRTVNDLVGSLIDELA